MAIIVLTCIFACQSFAEETVPAKKDKPAAKAPAKTPVQAKAAKLGDKAAAKAPAKKTTVQAKAAKLGDKAALLTELTYVKGDPVTFKEGKVYVVEFWATWCGPCRTSIPHLTKVQKQYKDKGVTVIGISNEKKLEKVKNYVTEQGEKMNYTVAVDPERKTSKGYMTAYKQRGIPSAFIVNQKGNIAWVGHPMGEMDGVLK